MVKGTIMVVEHEEQDSKSKEERRPAAKSTVFQGSSCPSTGISYDEPAPNLFSFNSPYGACPQCNGLGEISEIDINKIVANPKLSIAKGAIAPIGALKGGGTGYLNKWKPLAKHTALASKHRLRISA